MLILALALRAKLPNNAIDLLINIIDLHLPFSHHKSLYKFMQGIPEGETLKYYYCESCCEILKEKITNKYQYKCKKCRKRYKKRTLESKENFFLYSPLLPQLEKIVTSDLHQHFRKECNESDVINGLFYKRLRAKNIIKDNDITLQVNTDGLKIKKNTKKVSWAILATILELPPRLRNKNQLLLGFWYGTRKPCMNMFMQPFAEEMRLLNETGFNSTPYLSDEEVNIKVHVLLFTVDSVARPLVQNMSQFNGEYGCPYCLQKGHRIRVGNGTSRIYRYGKYKARTEEQHWKHIKSALKKKERIKGVKGPSILQSIPGLHIIHGFPPDYLHSCLEGVGKMIALAWFDPQYKDKPFYLNKKTTKKQKELAERLENIMPPKEITRVARALDKDYKASEWKNFILYYSEPCLKGLMSQKYYNHWHLFVSALHILLKNEITEDELTKAEQSLTQFVSMMEELYGEEFMTFNVHLLTHTCTYVKYYGALWAWSTFPFESFNGVIKTLHNGTQYIPNQVLTSYHRLVYLKNNWQVFSKPNVHPQVLKIFLKAMSQCQVTNCIEYDDELRVFGTPARMEFDAIERHVLKAVIGFNVECALSYDRFIYKKVVYNTSSYMRFEKRMNCMVLTTDDNFVEISDLLVINRYDEDEDEENSEYVILGNEMHVMDDVICNYGPCSSEMYSCIVKKTKTKVCYKLQSLKHKCIMIPYENEEKYCIMPLVNTIETD